MAANNRARVCTIPITPSFCLTLATVLSPLQSRQQSLLCVSVCTTYAGRKTADEPCHRRCDFRFSYITIDSHGAPCSERARNPRLMSTNGKRNGWLVENQTTKEYRWHERTRPEICSFRVFSLSIPLLATFSLAQHNGHVPTSCSACNWTSLLQRNPFCAVSRILMERSLGHKLEWKHAVFVDG